MNLEKARFNMVEQQIRPWDVLDQNVLDLLMTARRERFVPENAREVALADVEIPIGYGQFMLRPVLEAKALQAVTIKPGDNVLEVGAGTGFFASLLAARAGHVTTLEIAPALARMAHENLTRSLVQNVSVENEDGIHGWSKLAPYDVVMLSGGVSEIPEMILAQLKPGGRLFAFVGEAPVMKGRLVTRESEERFNTQDLFETLVPVLRGDTAAAFRF